MIYLLRAWIPSCSDFFLARASGINGESSFEAELLEKAPGCQVWGYDFSVSGVSFPSQPPEFLIQQRCSPFTVGT